MALVGVASMISSLFYSSTILALIGLGLTFWGVVLLYTRPHPYVRSDLMDSTALSSFRTIDRVMTGLGYREKGVYIPVGNPEKVIVLVPSEPLTRIPKPQEILERTFLENPKGVIITPPGLSLAALIEKELAADFEKLTLHDLSKRLARPLVENLEVAQDFDMNVNGEHVEVKMVDSIYTNFCSQLRRTTKYASSLGCPICSAIACILAMVTRRPVSFEQEEFSPDRRTLKASYRIIKWS